MTRTTPIGLAYPGWVRRIPPMGMVTTTFTVLGMTCGHCASSVEEELREVHGVSDVIVDLETGAVTVDADRAIAPEVLAAAVAEAGYEVAA